MNPYNGSHHSTYHESLPLRRVAQTWWPLAASWLLMGAELPAISAIVARLAEPKIHLAAYGGVVFPLALLVESPIIMLLAASTALSKDWDSYLKLRRFMMRAGALLTTLHVLVAFTPLYYVVVAEVIGAPPEILEPARVGLMIMTPWTWAIAYRRFNQGVLIRFGHSRAVGLGTILRLGADGVVLTVGYLQGTIPGIVVATSTVIAGVIIEAIYSGLCVRPVLRNQLKRAAPIESPLTFTDLMAFYIPLAMTSLLNLLVQPIGSAALSRMPQALESLAVWPIVSGLIFMHRSLGIAYNEVVVALLDEPKSTHSLHRFATWLSILTTLLLLAIASTPLSIMWFKHLSALTPQLATMAHLSLWIALPIPGLNALQSWYQGAIMHKRRTRAITEAVAIFLLASSAILAAGVGWGQVTGLFIGMAGFGIGSLAQTAWLWYRSRPVLRDLRARDAQAMPLQAISSPITSK
ncbi:MAG: hypothetical protein JSV81_20165 [Anaerolineales bacterium]|nr:MAG: hypothetical protein JSV81_20165 [Anaerolineales bacterium]